MSQTLMIVEKTGNCLSWYDLENGALKHRLGLSEMPHEFVIDTENRYAYVGHYGVLNSKTAGDQGRSVFVVDVALGAIVHTFTLGEHARPHGLGLDGLGRLYVLSELTGTLLINEKPRDFGPFTRFRPVGGKKAHLFALARDGRRAYSINLDSSDVTVFDPYDDAEPVSIKTGNRPEGRWLREDEKILFVTNRGDDTISVIDTRSLAILNTIKTPKDPMRVMHDPRRNRILSINNQGCSLSIFDGVSGGELHRLDLPDRPITMCADETLDYLYLARRMDKLHKISLDDFSVVNTLTTLELPDIMHILPQGFQHRWG